MHRIYRRDADGGHRGGAERHPVCGEGLSLRPGTAPQRGGAGRRSYGNIVDAVTPHLPYFPTEQEESINDNDLRCAELAERLGYDGCRALFAACRSL